jgi:hypothetical protein
MIEQKRLKKEEMLKMIEEECANDPEFQIIKSDAIAESEANPDKKKKKKNQNKKEEPTTEQINSEVQEELGDLLSSMNIGGKN